VRFYRLDDLIDSAVPAQIRSTTPMVLPLPGPGWTRVARLNKDFVGRAALPALSDGDVSPAPFPFYRRG
jgi:hypothetical protein